MMNSSLKQLGWRVGGTGRQKPLQRPRAVNAATEGRDRLLDNYWEVMCVEVYLCYRSRGDRSSGALDTILRAICAASLATSTRAAVA